ncbi:NmrA-like family domain-containing protein 1 [Rhodotorula toruloides]|nr:NmrA-like family domain-containing protein 1 [Rhodotorula toruloides]
MSSARTSAVVGATGHQESGVVAALLSSTSFSVRALSTNPSGSKAASLLAQHDTYVKAEGLAENEVEQGKTLVDVAKAKGIEHFVYSSLPSIAKASGGKYTRVAPFEHKAEIEQYAKEKLDNMTVLIPGCRFTRDDGTAIFNVAGSLNLQLGWLDDGHDVGTYAAAAFAKGPAATAGKTCPIEVPYCTMDHIAAQYEAVTGEKAIVQATPIDVAFASAPEALLPSLTEVFQYMNEVEPESICHGTMKSEEDKSFEDLGVKASSFKAFLERTGFKVGVEAK